VSELATGIYTVTTESHGGIYLAPARQATLPAWALGIGSRYCAKPAWWEEDCEAVVPLLAFHADMPDWIRDKGAGYWADNLRAMYPALYEGWLRSPR